MLKGKVALVTGAARGIGKEIALTLSGAGATVVVNYNGSKQRAEAVVKEIEQMGGSALAYQCNVADDKESAQMVKDVLDAYGKVDILVNNAGITRDNLIMRMTEEDYDAVLDTNLKGAFHMIRHLSRAFIKQRCGKIINISSVWGTYGASCEAAYSATKGGLNSYTKALAKELAPSNISVNALAPGAIDTKMNSHLSDEDRRLLEDEIPFGRMGTVDEVADMLYCLYEAPVYLTGQIIGFDGAFC